MNNKGKNILALAGVISTVLGIVIAIPAFLQSRDFLGVLGTLFIITGLVLVAIAWGDLS